jgi:hypothetical protein
VINLSAPASTMVKLSTWLEVIVVVDCVAFLIAMAFIAWRAWQAFRRASQTLDKVDRSLESVATSIGSLVEIREQELMASQNRVNPVAVKIVVDNAEIFDAKPQTREIGIGVFTVRNVGNDSVFIVGVTRTAEDGMPQGQGRLLTPLDGRDVHLRLAPDDPPLDMKTVTIWYRDLQGQHWRRSLADPQATQVAGDSASLAVEQPTGEIPALETGGQEASNREAGDGQETDGQE